MEDKEQKIEEVKIIDSENKNTKSTIYSKVDVSLKSANTLVIVCAVVFILLIVVFKMMS